MKTIILILSFTLFFQSLTAQEIIELEKALDSLKNLKESYSQKILEINNNYARIEEILIKKRLDQTIGEFYYSVSGTNITKTPDKYEVLANLPSNSKVKLLGQNETHFKILFKNYTGWVIKVALITEAEFLAKLKSIREKEISDSINHDAELKRNTQYRIEEEKRLKKQREETSKRLEEADKQRKDLLIKKYGNETGLRIYSGKIWIGMTSRMVEESIGYPKNINRTVFSGGVHEQWVYTRLYVYIENGILTSWQDER